MNDEATSPIRYAVTHREKHYHIALERYSNNDNTAIELIDKHGVRQYTATANLEPLPAHLCYIKDYSENKGMVHALRKLLKPTGAERHSGHVIFKQFRINDELLVAFGFAFAAAGATPTTDDIDEEPVVEPPAQDTDIEVDTLPEDDMPADATAGIPDWGDDLTEPEPGGDTDGDEPESFSPAEAHEEGDDAPEVDPEVESLASPPVTEKG